MRWHVKRTLSRLLMGFGALGLLALLQGCSEADLSGDCKRYCEKAYGCLGDEADATLSLSECKDACSDSANAKNSYVIDPDVVDCAELSACEEFFDCVEKHGTGAE